MNKIIKKGLLAFCFMVLTACAQKHNEEDDFQIEIIDFGRSAAIIGYSGTKQAIRIPSRIKELPVTAIGDEAFAGNTSLTSIAIPGSVSSIGQDVFWNCTSLSSVTIPGSVTSISAGTFVGCASLTAIIVSPDNLTYSSLDNILYDKNQYTLINYPPGKTGDFTIPDNVTRIEDLAFAHSKGLTGITLPENLKSIGIGAFIGCDNLTEITIPDSVTDIWDWAFALSGLTSITIPANVTNIGEAAFVGCIFLEEINVSPNNQIYSSTDGVLYDKEQRTLIAYPSGKEGAFEIPNTVSSIGDMAFWYSFNLSSANIPSSVNSIGNQAFADCDSLESVRFGNNHTIFDAETFPGDLHAKYTDSTGGRGTYTTETPGDDAVWQKQ